MKRLPKKHRGAEVARGLGMKADAFEKLVEQKAMDVFDATRDLWIVVEDGALGDPDHSVEVKGFADKNTAVRYARARANGNVDQRVLRVTSQVLVVATENEL